MRRERATSLAIAARRSRARRSAAGCGEKAETVDRRAARAVHARARLLRQPRPRRASTRRSSAATSSEAGLDVDTAGPLRPLGADQAGRRRPRRPRDLLRARGAAGPRPGPAGDRGRAPSSTEPLTSLISLPEAGIADAGRPARARRSPPPASPTRPTSSTTILAEARASSSTTSTRSTSASACCRRCSPGRADAMLGGFLNVEGVDLAERGREPDGGPGRPARHPHLRRARAGRQLRPPRGRPGADPAVHRRARARHARRPVADPAAATEAVLDAGDGPRPEADRGRGRRDAAAAAARQRHSSRSATWTRREWERFARSSPTTA